MAPYYNAIYRSIVDYKGDCSFLERILRTHHEGGEVRSILDVGCGTGNHAFILAKKGYEVTGIDVSRAMIKIAMSEKNKMKNPQFFEMDMRRIDLLHLEKPFDAIVSFFGGFGYLLRDSDIERFFSSANRNLSEDGLLFFEFWQSSGVRPESRASSGFRSWVGADDEGRGWHIIRLDTSRFDRKTKLITLNLEGYVLDSKRKVVLDSFCEVHRLRTFSLAEIKRLLTKNKLKPLVFYDTSLNKKKQSLRPVTTSNFRVTSVAKLAN